MSEPEGPGLSISESASLEHGYRRLLAWSLAHRGLVAIGAVLVLLSSVPLFLIANKNFLPNDAFHLVGGVLVSGSLPPNS